LITPKLNNEIIQSVSHSKNLLIETAIRETARNEPTKHFISSVVTVGCTCLFAARLNESFGLFILSLEHVALPILKLHIAISLILNEHPAQLRSILKEKTAPANSAIIGPLTIIKIAVSIVVNTRAIALTVLEIAFIVLAVAEENFDLTILDFAAFKPRLNYLVRQREQSPITLWSVVAPLSLVDCARRTKLTHAGA